MKVCCISSPAEAALAVEYGADALGLVAEMPSGPGILRDAQVREIAATVPPGVDTFLLTSLTEAAGIVEQVRFCGTTTVQIVSHIDPKQYPAIIERLPNVRRVQVIHVQDEQALDLITRYAPFVHAFLLDSGRPDAAVAELGGTGRTHDWRISARFVTATDKPVFLAGGLRPDNVAAAIAQVQPYGIDLCSGVRSDDQLDATKLAAFVQDLGSAGVPGEDSR
ncbi:MAG: phosphoribosylanthranilate isomerase [Pseudomonadota bacterium]